MSLPTLNIIIVGNGIAGPVLAMALQKCTKHNVLLVDAGPEDASPIGASVAIAPNGLNALKFIGADHIVTEKGCKLLHMSIGRGESGQLFTDQDTADLFTQKYGYAGYGIKRQDICSGLRELAKERKIDMRYNLRLKTIEQTGNTVTTTFANGETLKADLLIGCDGIHSATRTFVVGQETNPDFAGTSIVLGLAKLTPEEEKAAGLVKGFSMWIDNGVVFGAYSCDNEGNWCSFTGFPTKDPAGGETEWHKDDHSVEQFAKLAEEKTAGWNAPHTKAILPKLWRAFPLGLYDRKPIGTWHKGRVVLVGDAAHATTPFGGQGSQMAIESAIILARLLGENEPSDQIFQLYHDIRHERTDWVTISSNRGINNMFSGGITGWVRTFMLRMFGGYFFRSGFLGHYAYDAGTVPLKVGHNTPATAASNAGATGGTAATTTSTAITV